MTDIFASPEGSVFTPTEPGVRRTILVHLPEMMMVRVEFEAGAVGAPHKHPHIQSSYVESGSFDVTIDGRTERLPKGGAFIVPTNLVHGVVALEPGVLIDVFTPRRDEFL
jgi:quercetin dioxygenase-like cupin family protein